MDECSGKRAVGGVVISRKGSARAFRDSASGRDRNAQFCSRIGCSGRPNSLKGTQLIGSGKGKSSCPSFRFSSNGKEIIGSSSRACSAINNSKRSFAEPQKRLTTQIDTDSSETSSVQDEHEIPNPRMPLEKTQRELQPESEGVESSEVTSVVLGSSSVASNTRSRKNLCQISGLPNLDSPVGPLVSPAPISTSNNTRANASRCGLKNFKCNSIADVIPSGCSSSSESNVSRKKGPLKKRNCEGESSSSARGKKLTGSSPEGQNPMPSHGISISDSRRARNSPTIRANGISTVWNRRSFNGYSRTRLASLENRNGFLHNEFSLVSQQIPQSDITVDPNDPRISQQFSLESSSSLLSSYSRLRNSNEYMRGIRPASPAEGGSTRSLIDRESFQHYDMDGIAEVLLALERIERDVELTYEQLRVLDTSFFPNGFNFYDRHREMRLDIDNMSYEELLALEERMGSVSTALTEETLSACLTTCIYQSTPMEDASAICSGDKNDVKCSICQEEYAASDEVGRLQCLHRYHVTCIQQWLRLKNWCPICKASAVPPPTASTPP